MVCIFLSHTAVYSVYIIIIVVGFEGNILCIGSEEKEGDAALATVFWSSFKNSEFNEVSHNIVGAIVYRVQHDQ